MPSQRHSPLDSRLTTMSRMPTPPPSQHRVTVIDGGNDSNRIRSFEDARSREPHPDVRKIGLARGTVYRPLPMDGSVDRWMRARIVGVALAGGIMLMMIVAALVPSITSTHVVAILGSIAAFIALLAFVALVDLMLYPVLNPKPRPRDVTRAKSWQPDTRFWYSGHSRS